MVGKMFVNKPQAETSEEVTDGVVGFCREAKIKVDETGLYRPLLPCLIGQVRSLNQRGSQKRCNAHVLSFWLRSCGAA